jgi:hypothetical protein
MNEPSIEKSDIIEDSIKEEETIIKGEVKPAEVLQDSLNQEEETYENNNTEVQTLLG